MSDLGFELARASAPERTGYDPRDQWRSASLFGGLLSAFFRAADSTPEEFAQ